MSRYVKKIDDEIDIVYGFDHALGYFIQKFNKKLISERNEEGVEYDKSSMFDRMTNSEFTGHLTEFKCNPEHIARAAMDLDF